MARCDGSSPTLLSVVPPNSVRLAALDAFSDRSAQMPSWRSDPLNDVTLAAGKQAQRRPHKKTGRKCHE
jgi:hypothetical protein